MKPNPFIDDYRLNWCFRYLREANADYECSKLVKNRNTCINLCSTALRKAQTAVLYALGEPTQVYNSIIAVLEGRVEADDPLIRTLTSMERFIRELIDGAPSIPRESLIRMTGEHISVAEKLVRKILEAYERDERLNRPFHIHIRLGMRTLTCSDGAG
ncbi:hypothetical protein CW710_01665 [Candidatus Bathyarchaeota archaeon]|nr:hypothetical protein [Candidatus Bathyarchaeota archaeon]RJS74410.1 MAG: hypothetical protein CW710_01665 [Candidatus Bathyarchaeota archaeon]